MLRGCKSLRQGQPLPVIGGEWILFVRALPSGLTTRAHAPRLSRDQTHAPSTPTFGRIGSDRSSPSYNAHLETANLDSPLPLSAATTSTSRHNPSNSIGPSLRHTPLPASSQLTMSALLRPSSCARAARAVTMTARTTTAAPAASSIRAFSGTPQRLSGGKLEYDPPTGWLFGVKPGEKYQREGWEMPFYWLFCGGLVVFSVAYAFKPDTS